MIQQIRLTCDSRSRKIAYLNEVNYLRAVINNNFSVGYSHIGSTAIHGALSRNIIDIGLGVVNSFDLLLVKDYLRQRGYILLHNQSSLEDFQLARVSRGKVVCIVHVMLYGSKAWNESRIFVDFMNKNPNWVTRYNFFKYNILFKECQGLNTYNRMKKSFYQKAVEVYMLHV